MSDTKSVNADGCWGCKWFQEWLPKVRDDGMSCRGQCNNLRVTIGAPIPVYGAGCKHKETDLFLTREAAKTKSNQD